MKNHWSIIRAGVVIFAASAFAGNLMAQDGLDCVPELDPDCSAEVDLIAGQSMDVGTVLIQQTADTVCVTYLLDEGVLAEGMLIHETHLAIGTDLADIPQTKGNKWGTNPIPGNFPYKGTLKGGGSPCWNICIPLVDIGYEPGDTLYVAAHAVVGIVDDCGPYMTETAWGDGTRFNERGNWGMYIVVEPCWVELVPSYIGYEDNDADCDFDYNDFGMDFMGVETYAGGILRMIQLEFTARVNRAGFEHNIHIFRSLKGDYTYTLLRDHVPVGNETMVVPDTAGSGDFDVILFDTTRWANDPSQVLGHTVTITIVMDEANVENTLADFGPAPRFDLGTRFSLYDPWMENQILPYDPTIASMKPAVPDLPAGDYSVPCIIVVPQCDWPHPDEGEIITNPYPEFYDYYSTQSPAYADWWMTP